MYLLSDAIGRMTIFNGGNPFCRNLPAESIPVLTECGNLHVLPTLDEYYPGSSMLQSGIGSSIPIILD